MLEIVNVSKTFGTTAAKVRALENVTLTVGEAQCCGIIGESGSGKSTLACIAAGITVPDAGHVTLAGERLDPRRAASRRRHQKQLHMIFQDPRSSFNPRMSIGESLSEPLQHKRRLRRAERKELITAALEEVGLTADLIHRGIDSLSVGQGQRVAIARAILAEPDLIICDEITSALDVTVQAEILDLLVQLRRKHHFSMLFISHDIAVVAHLADRIAVMKHGHLIEEGPSHEIINAPTQAYTRLLIDLV
ncbi:ATP-binding cassette domain-containing protein [Dermatophilus congolensis]|uniref:ATP-binding cassette domain-containing protein n=1 Tax=Dermatophilus congolensis TaxID=1863 RepID=UPI001AAF1615|nr:ABC transporter ATP-binding protein [Dermatophilus congolensis]MBO3131081.1 ABC transporter ATP-binding protein [Dermatophilus congolensis]MBO3134759.1 ABC transporter ATP-binding protein [Dermatophilus congolensis]MBO3136995.1 ABC transporter ATP-binding protein [Dermatophilus congolensis]MBO3139240.1 ABC transporter ATP-binding protein [Dermatophilus congolensis]